MNRRFVRAAATALSLVVVMFCSIAWAAAGPATDVVKTKQSALFAALKAGDDKKVSSLFDEMLDYKAFSEQSLGTAEWNNRSDSEKAEFSSLLKQLVRRSYECNLKKILDFDIDYVGEVSAGNGVSVQTKAKKSGEDPVEINFKMVDTGKSSWKIQDIETESVSLVSNNRSQFNKIIREKGFAALIQKMKDKLAKPSCE